MNKYLPIGTVVLLKEAEKKLMIIGYGCNNENKMYDYAGCLYPEGIFNLENLFAFDHEQISHIFHTGFIDEEQENFQSKLKDIIYTFDTPTNNNSISDNNIELLDINN